MHNTQNKKQKNTTSQKRKSYVTILLLTLSGAIMIGHGARMLYQGLFAPGTSYTPNTFDLFFDWLTLAILGCGILWFAFSLYYRTLKTRGPSQTRGSQQEETVLSHPT
ncbi:MAG: hypothetical protein JXA00_02625 [Candidatus Thermoplasmatota archaeon]|nr:hypothetical protein [Candidatus Thermoplasmatota archaeon]